jgi:hypothetical protein
MGAGSVSSVDSVDSVDSGEETCTVRSDCAVGGCWKAAASRLAAGERQMTAWQWPRQVAADGASSTEHGRSRQCEVQACMAM